MASCTPCRQFHFDLSCYLLLLLLPFTPFSLHPFDPPEAGAEEAEADAEQRSANKLFSSLFRTRISTKADPLTHH